ncbi:MAG: 16S rRNA (cytidine(1402)-2'-O)-methyltransferase [Candidatus Kapabacteria bacterium]|nr:16S rRNA (cytidine(1402)-2'-O)-methyltransferase [Candidatus Kapabacteria bacterium]
MSDVQRRHETYMRQALELAAGAAAEGDVPVGCVIVCNDEVIGRGSNEIQRKADPTRHAEVVAIEEAVRAKGEKFLADCTLYVTLEPCTMCAGAIVLARIPTVVYGAADPKTGACRSLFELVDDPRLNHAAIVRSGILEDECSSMLSAFFARQRSDDGPSQRPAEPASTPPAQAGGVLWLIPTPIGNLEDMTLRSVKSLREADVIVCEDTRTAGPLLKRYDVPRKPLLSYHEHNERERAVEIVQRVRSGQKVALISDAGMPGISDPGYRAVRACAEAGLKVSALPGASAGVTAVAASGLPTDRILFAGFLPQKKGRSAALAGLLAIQATIVMYESPHRLLALLEEIRTEAGPDRPVVVAREISKRFEEYIRGTAQQVHDVCSQRASVKGECVVMIGPTSETGD